MNALLLACLTLLSPALYAQKEASTDDLRSFEVELKFKFAPGDLLYKDYIDISVDNPDITISSWSSNIAPISFFDPNFKETKKVYNQPLVITCTLNAPHNASLDTANLHLTYYLRSQKMMQQATIPLVSLEKMNTKPSQVATPPPLATAIDTQAYKQPAQPIQPKVPDVCETKEEKQSWTCYFSTLLAKTNSLSVQLLLVFLLGLLMSLTPCLYPMLPITAGILQAQESSSLLTSFLVSLSYTTGIATTFATLGLLAAFAGQAIGSIMVNPWFILPLILILIYLAFAMMGFYEMYTPAFLKSNGYSVKGGSFISAFIFGAISGTVASPCLSPGLVLLLSIVSTMNSIMLGFILLFVFGLGLGLPLLIIGTFSNSLQMLPRAGMWMVEIKTLFGTIMLAMCFYFLRAIVPWHILLMLLTAFTIITGICYLYSAHKTHDALWRFLKNIIGIGLIALSCILCYEAYHTMKAASCETVDHTWITDYTCALEKATIDKKLLFVDIGAPFCSICKALDKTLFADKNVVRAFEKFVCVKVNGSDDANKEIMQRFSVVGFPTVLVINPDDQSVIHRWGPELYGMKPAEFIGQLAKIPITK